MLRFNLRLLLLMVALAAVLIHENRNQIKELFLRTYGDAPAKLMGSLAGVVTRSNGNVVVDRRTYASGPYMVSEFGSIRLAVDNPGSGISGGEILVASNRKALGGVVSGTGVGTRRFTTTIIDNGSECTFGNLDFKIVGERLELLGERFLVTGVPKLIVVSDGRIKAVARLEGTIDEQ